MHLFTYARMHVFTYVRIHVGLRIPVA